MNAYRSPSLYRFVMSITLNKIYCIIHLNKYFRSHFNWIFVCPCGVSFRRLKHWFSFFYSFIIWLVLLCLQTLTFDIGVKISIKQIIRACSTLAPIAIPGCSDISEQPFCTGWFVLIWLRCLYCKEAAYETVKTFNHIWYGVYFQLRALDHVWKIFKSSKPWKELLLHTNHRYVTRLK